MGESRLERQLQFILEIDKLKSVLRQSELLDADRRENSAEHSWHIALMAIVLEEYAEEPIELSRVVKMLLVHDIVEIDAGDTFCYDEAGNADKTERELAAADRIFGLLPPEQAAEFHQIWQEFEAQTTAEAHFANAVDRMMPLFHNFFNAGGSWQRHGVTEPQVQRRIAPIKDGSESLWLRAEILVADAIARGYLSPGNNSALGMSEQGA